jgi:phosphatidate cytidylyltransferase
MFTARLATAFVLLVGFVAALIFLPTLWWAALLLVIVAMAGWEWGALAGYGRALRWGYTAIIGGSALAIGAIVTGSANSLMALEASVYGTSCAFWVLVALPWLALRRNVRSPFALGLAGWMVLVPTWLALARLQPQPGQLLALLGVVWVADTAAYLAGKAWGRHRLAPEISPAKTWEGLAGAGAGVGVYYCAVSYFTPEWGWWQGWIGISLFGIVALASVVGDLFESWIKRQAGVKDSGSLLPGHGGILDRIDSMTSSMPFAALALHYIV